MNDKILSLSFYALVLIVALVGTYLRIVPTETFIAVLGLVTGIQIPSPFQQKGTTL